MVLEMAQFISITQGKESLGDNNKTRDPLTTLLSAESLDKLVDELEILVDDEELGGIIGHNKDNSEILEDNEDPVEILGQILDGGEDLGEILGHNEDHREVLEDSEDLGGITVRSLKMMRMPWRSSYTMRTTGRSLTAVMILRRSLAIMRITGRSLKRILGKSLDMAQRLSVSSLPEADTISRDTTGETALTTMPRPLDHDSLDSDEDLLLLEVVHFLSQAFGP